jgi:hypothetical protein
MVINGLPRRKVFGQHTPLRTGFEGVQNRVNDLFSGMLARMAARILRLKVVFDHRPFLVLQITGVAHAHDLSKNH